MWSSSSAKRSQKNAATAAAAEKATATAADATSAWQFATWHEIKLFDLSRRQRVKRGIKGKGEARLLRYSLNETKWCVRQRRRRQRRSRWRYFGNVRKSPHSLSLSLSLAPAVRHVLRKYLAKQARQEILLYPSRSGATHLHAYKKSKKKTKTWDTKHEIRHRRENNNNRAGILFYCFSPDSRRSCGARSFRFAWPSAWAAIRRSLIAFVYVWQRASACVCMDRECCCFTSIPLIFFVLTQPIRTEGVRVINSK